MVPHNKEFDCLFAQAVQHDRTGPETPGVVKELINDLQEGSPSFILSLLSETPTTQVALPTNRRRNLMKEFNSTDKQQDTHDRTKSLFEALFEKTTN